MYFLEKPVCGNDHICPGLIVNITSDSLDDDHLTQTGESGRDLGCPEVALRLVPSTQKVANSRKTPILYWLTTYNKSSQAQLELMFISSNEIT